jgi:thiamine-phosphate pyrophosphorylase
MIQYRNKSASAALRKAQALELQALCARFKVPFIVNDSADLAGETGADGVHLGRDDGDPEAARRLLGKAAIIGVSCYADLDLASRMAAQGADYLAFGRFFASHTKPQATPATIEVLRRARSAFRLPLVAIGGINPENAPLVVAAGADAIAVCGGVFDADDTRGRASHIAALFDQREHVTDRGEDR